MPQSSCPVHDLRCVSGGPSGHGCGWRSYRCSRCGGCYQCEHQAVYDPAKDVTSWKCRDGRVRPVIAEPCGCTERARPPVPMEFRPPARIAVPDVDWPI
jgi:hypothetical protein